MSLHSIVKIEENHYCVDSCYTLDHGYETMVFSCDDKGNVTDWNDLYAKWYDTHAKMETGHREIVANLQRYL